MHLVSRRDRGSATAEWALALPAVVLVAGALISGIGVMIDQSRLDHAAAEAARRASLGQPVGESIAALRAQTGLDYRVSIQASGDSPTACVVLTRATPPDSLWSSPLELTARACFLDETP